MKLRKINKKAGLESEGVIVWIIVIATVIMGIVFVASMNWDSIIKNFPGFQGEGEEDREIDADITIEICPDGYEIIGELRGAGNPYSFFLKEGDLMKDTNLKWNLGSNKIEIQKWGFLNDLRLGDNKEGANTKTLATYRDITIDSEAFKRGTDLFTSILKEELNTEEEIFKTLLLIDNASMRGNNQICQKSTTSFKQNIGKELNKIYWGVEEPDIIDLSKEIQDRTKDKITFYEEKGYKLINLRPYISYSSIQGSSGNSFYLGLKKQDSKISLYLIHSSYYNWRYFSTSSKDRYYKIGFIQPDGRISLFCNSDQEFNKEEYYHFLLAPEGFRIRMPNKNGEISKEVSSFPHECNTTIFLSSSAIQIAINPSSTPDINKIIFDSKHYSSSGDNSVPTIVTNH